MNALRHFTTHFYQTNEGRAVPDIQGRSFQQKQSPKIFPLLKYVTACSLYSIDRIIDYHVH